MGSWGDFFNDFAIGLNQTLPREIIRSNEARRLAKERRETLKQHEAFLEEQAKRGEQLREQQQAAQEQRRLKNLYGPKGAEEAVALGEEPYKQKRDEPGLEAFYKMLTAEEEPSPVELTKVPTALRGQVATRTAEIRKQKATKAETLAQNTAFADEVIAQYPQMEGSRDRLITMGREGVGKLLSEKRAGETAEARAGTAEARAKLAEANLSLAQERGLREQEKFDITRKDLPIDPETHRVWSPVFKKKFGYEMPPTMKQSVFEQTKSVLEGELKSAEKKINVPNQAYEMAARQVVGDEWATRKWTDLEAQKVAMKVQQNAEALARAGAAGRAAVITPMMRNTFRQSYMNDPTTKRFTEMRDSYQRIIATSNKPIGDVALIFGMMKMLDPISVVREGEYKTARQTGAIPDRLWNAFNQLWRGTSLTPTQRKEFRSESERLFRSQLGSQASMESEFRRIAGTEGMDQEMLPDVMGAHRKLLREKPTSSEPIEYSPSGQRLGTPPSPPPPRRPGLIESLRPYLPGFLGGE